MTPEIEKELHSSILTIMDNERNLNPNHSFTFIWNQPLFENSQIPFFFLTCDEFSSFREELTQTYNRRSFEEALLSERRCDGCQDSEEEVVIEFVMITYQWSNASYWIYRLQKWRGSKRGSSLLQQYLSWYIKTASWNSRGCSYLFRVQSVERSCDFSSLEQVLKR